MKLRENKNKGRRRGPSKEAIAFEALADDAVITLFDPGKVERVQESGLVRLDRLAVMAANVEFTPDPYLWGHVCSLGYESGVVTLRADRPEETAQLNRLVKICGRCAPSNLHRLKDTDSEVKKVTLLDGLCPCCKHKYSSIEGMAPPSRPFYHEDVESGAIPRESGWGILSAQARTALFCRHPEGPRAPDLFFRRPALYALFLNEPGVLRTPAMLGMVERWAKKMVGSPLLASHLEGTVTGIAAEDGALGILLETVDGEEAVFEFPEGWVAEVEIGDVVGVGHELAAPFSREHLLEMIAKARADAHPNAVVEGLRNSCVLDTDRLLELLFCMFSRGPQALGLKREVDPVGLYPPVTWGAADKIRELWVDVADLGGLGVPQVRRVPGLHSTSGRWNMRSETHWRQLRGEAPGISWDFAGTEEVAERRRQFLEYSLSKKRESRQKKKGRRQHAAHPSQEAGVAEAAPAAAPEGTWKALESLSLSRPFEVDTSES